VNVLVLVSVHVPEPLDVFVSGTFTFRCTSTFTWKSGGFCPASLGIARCAGPVHSNRMNLAFFVSPHGFGHAARACAVMSALGQRHSNLHVEIFTRVPVWFFQQSLDSTVRFEYHELQTDVGFIQASSMVEDYGATIDALERLYPLSSDSVSEIAGLLRERAVSAVLCDISALGIVAAEKVGIPSVLIENFTWDWIYSGYVGIEPRFERFIDYLRPLYDRATVRVQTEPVCRRVGGVPNVRPIARRRRARDGGVRQALGIEVDTTVVLCSMGGIPGSFKFVPSLATRPDVVFVLAGCEPLPDMPGNVRAIPHRSDFYHPDLVATADAVVGKVGYSTVAEAYYGRTQFLYLPRPLFAESAVMEDFVTAELCGRPIAPEAYDDGSWMERLPHILQLPDQTLVGPRDGAEDLLDILDKVLR
jgi:hypothetical protein